MICLGRRHKAMLDDATSRIMELEDAVMCILDIASGWTRPMSDERRLEFVVQVGTEVLGGAPLAEPPDGRLPGR